MDQLVIAFGFFGGGAAIFFGLGYFVTWVSEGGKLL